ncbi:hypothetical protein LCGC14_2792450, partial [marine sediment metagenome]
YKGCILGVWGLYCLFFGGSEPIGLYSLTIYYGSMGVVTLSNRRRNKMTNMIRPNAIVPYGRQNKMKRHLMTCSVH